MKFDIGSEKLSSLVDEYNDAIQYVVSKVNKHNLLASEQISLVASGNVVSKRVLQLMNTDLLHRASVGKGPQKCFPGLDNFYELEEESEVKIASIFNADFADLRPISGSQANLIIYAALTKPGDTILTPTIKQGAHISMSGKVVREQLSISMEPIAFQKGTFAIDVDVTIAQIKKYKPKIVVLGGSVITEWSEIHDIILTAHKAESIVLFDASHIAGLIATKVFPNPIDFGVDLMSLTTCKTIPGPSHAWILGDRKYKKKIEDKIFPGFIAGGHLQEHVGAIVSLYEIMKYGTQYGQTIINHANSFGETLSKHGFEIVRTTKGTVTETHQIIVKQHELYPAKFIEQELSKIGILCNVNPLPKDSFGVAEGLRFGTQEVVRLGIDHSQIVELACLIGNYFKDYKIENMDSYREKVKNIKKDLQEAIYT